MGGQTQYYFYKLWLAIGAALIALTIWFSIKAQPPGWAFAWGSQPLHTLVYATLVFWFGQIYHGLWRQAALAAAFIAMGAGLEFLQTWLTTVRRFDGADIAANSIGAVAAWILLQTPLGRLLGWLDHHLGRLANHG